MELNKLKFWRYAGFIITTFVIVGLAVFVASSGTISKMTSEIIVEPEPQAEPNQPDEVDTASSDEIRGPDALVGVVPPMKSEEQRRGRASAPATFTVTSVIDGDTIRLDTGEKVRLIGINAPESGQEYFVESRDELIRLVLYKDVILEKDVSETDRYGRLLRYVYVGDFFVNLEMVGRGFATAWTYPPDVEYSEIFAEAEREARNARVGLWEPESLEVETASDSDLSAEASAEAEGVSSVVPVENGDSVPPPETGAATSKEVICSHNAYDCSDFSSRAEAQKVFEYCGGTINDIHRLDGDKDGLVCESLPR